MASQDQGVKEQWVLAKGSELDQELVRQGHCMTGLEYTANVLGVFRVPVLVNSGGQCRAA